MKKQAQTEPTFSHQEIEILEAFLHFCFKNGIENATQLNVAKEAKVALATLQYYFGKGKPGLTASALRHVSKVGQDTTSRLLFKEVKKVGYKPIQAYIDVTFEWAKRRPAHASFWLYSHYMASIQSEYKTLHSQFLAGAKVRITSLLFEQFGRTGRTTTKSVENLADSIHSMLMGGIISSIIDSDSRAFEHQRRLISENTETLLSLSSKKFN